MLHYTVVQLYSVTLHIGNTIQCYITQWYHYTVLYYTVVPLYCVILHSGTTTHQKEYPEEKKGTIFVHFQNFQCYLDQGQIKFISLLNITPQEVSTATTTTTTTTTKLFRHTKFYFSTPWRWHHVAAICSSWCLTWSVFCDMFCCALISAFCWLKCGMLENAQYE